MLECVMGHGKLKSGLVVVWCFNGISDFITNDVL